jgi:hypothetical protein
MRVILQALIWREGWMHCRVFGISARFSYCNAISLSYLSMFTSTHRHMHTTPQ